MQLDKKKFLRILPVLSGSSAFSKIFFKCGASALPLKKKRESGLAIFVSAKAIFGMMQAEEKTLFS